MPMARQTVLVIDHDETDADMQALLLAETGNRFQSGNKLMQYVRSLMGGARSAKVSFEVTALKASGTVTLAAHVATNTVTINGVVLTAVSGAPGADQYDISGGMTTGATSLAAAITANSTLSGMVTAEAVGAVVTVSASRPGKLGNAVTLAISANGSVSGARLTGGSNFSAQKVHYYGSGY